MSRSSPETTSQIVVKSEILYCYYSASGHNDHQKTKRYAVLTKVKYINEDVNELQVYATSKKHTTQSALQKLLITADNLCGVVTGTDFIQSQHTGKKSTSDSSTLSASPYLVVVTLTGSVLLQQTDSSRQSVECHDNWFKTLKQQLQFVHSWPVTLDSVPEAPQRVDVVDDDRAFLCLNKQTISIVLRANYTCLMRSSRNECRMKLSDTTSQIVRLTIKRTTQGVETRYVVRTNKGIANSVMTSCGTTVPPVTHRPQTNSSRYGYITTTDVRPWTVIDTIIKLYNGNLPEQDTLGLSHTCLTELGIKLQSSPAQGCWRDLADHLGLTIDDVELIVNHASSRYNVPRVRPTIMMPAVYLLYHWQYVYNSLGVGEPPRTPRPCTKTELVDLLRIIGRNDLVALIEEWQQSITRI